MKTETAHSEMGKQTAMPIRIYSHYERYSVRADRMLRKQGKEHSDITMETTPESLPFAFFLEDLSPINREIIEKAGFKLKDADLSIEIEYPQYGEPRFYAEPDDGSFPAIVFEKDGQKYCLRLEVDDKEVFHRRKEALFIEEVDPSTPETPWLDSQYASGIDGYNYIQLFGQPDFCQNEYLITDSYGMRGSTAVPLLFLWSGFGDCGTEQFFVKFEDDGKLLVIREEACH